MKSGSRLNNFTTTMCPPSLPHPKTIYAQCTLHAREHVFKACIWTLDSILCLFVIACVCVCVAVWRMYYCNPIGVCDRATHNGLGKIAAVQ